jgi:hypothetical protein
VREFAPKFLRSALTWDFTVSADRPSLFAMCLWPVTFRSSIPSLSVKRLSVEATPLAREREGGAVSDDFLPIG